MKTTYNKTHNNNHIAMRNLLMMLGVFLIISTPTLALFTDVPESYEYYDAIEYLNEEGIIDGYPDGTYKAKNQINRAEFTKIVIASTYEESEIVDCKTSYFPDVNNNEWFAPYICIAKENEIIDGYPDKTFKPAQNISYVEAAKIIVNTFGYEIEENEVWYKPFTDLLESKNATPDSIKKVDQKINRGEMAEIIYRLLQLEVSDEDASQVELITAENPLENVQSWFYFINSDLEGVSEEIIDSNYDMVVIDPIITENGYDTEQWTKKIADIIEAIKNSKGANVENKIVIAYINVGQAESYRYYWGDDWGVGNPDYIVGDDPDNWIDNFPVAFWNDSWKNIVQDQLQIISTLGFDGIYMDWIEAYEDENVAEKADTDDIDATEEMIKFIGEISDITKTWDPAFIVIAQNASALAEFDDYTEAIDAIAQEQIWFDGSPEDDGPQGDCPLPETEENIDSDEYLASIPEGCPAFDYSSEEFINNLKVAQEKGIKIFTVDYALEENNIEMAHKKSHSLGFVPFTSQRMLDTFIQTE